MPHQHGTGAVRKNTHNAEGAIPTSPDGSLPTAQPPGVYQGEGNPNPPHGYDLDMGLRPNQFPQEHGSDTYESFPGDGSV